MPEQETVTLKNKITDKSVVSTPGSNAHVLLTQDVTLNGVDGHDVRRIEVDDFKDYLFEIATVSEVNAYLGIN